MENKDISGVVDSFLDEDIQLYCALPDYAQILVKGFLNACASCNQTRALVKYWAGEPECQVCFTFFNRVCADCICQAPGYDAYDWVCQRCLDDYAEESEDEEFEDWAYYKSEEWIVDNERDFVSDRDTGSRREGLARLNAHGF